jgi:hypothetical protein
VDVILKDIRNALASGQYFVAIMTTLTLPGVCAALEQLNGSTAGRDRALYEDWFTRYLGTTYSTMDPSDCYNLRCGVVHQGKFTHKQSNYDRIIFTLPDAHGTVIHNNVDIRGGANAPTIMVLNLDAITWCNDVINAVASWLIDTKTNSTVQTNMQGLVQFRAGGLPPYIVGVPVIA